MRLCFITREFPPFTRHSGGIGSQYAALTAELARQGHAIHVIYYGRRSTDFVHEGVNIHLTPWPRLWHFDNLAWSLAADRRLRSLGEFDAVYAAEWGADAWRYSARQANGPLVTNLQVSLAQVLALSSGLPATTRIQPRLLMTKQLERRQTERSSGIVGCSRAVLRWSGRLWQLDNVPNVAVLPNTTSVSRVRALVDGVPADGYPSEGPIVAFSGRLETRKGVQVLAAAMREVWGEYRTAHLVLVGGDYPYRGAKMSEHVLQEAGQFASNVHILGDQPPRRLFPCLAAADVVALPSLWEAFGIAALEAMALGKAVVLTSGSGYDDFAADERNSLVVAPDDARALARAISRLLGDSSLRRHLGAEAMQTADRLDAPAVARRHVEYFASLRSRQAEGAL